MKDVARNYNGRINYRGAHGSRGREAFSISVRPFGRTIRAYCEIDEDDLIRDASWTLDSQWQPIEGHVRVVLGAELAGSSWYLFTADGVECESQTKGFGRVSQRLPGRFAYLGLHPLVGDGMIAASRGCDAPGEERMIESVTSSYTLNGETNLVALPIMIGVTFIGEETVTVPAGEFLGRHFEIRWRTDWPPAHLWVHGDDYVFLRLAWEKSGLTSELVELTESSPAELPQP